jgi:hypothetical protein
MTVYKNFARFKGTVIITVLFIAVILLMYAGALFTLNQQNLRSVRANRDRIAAQQMAQAGINDVIHTIFLNTNFGKNQEVLEYTSSENPDLGYRVSFNPTDPYHSVNNLENPVEAFYKNFEGKKVARETIDIVSIGIAGKDSLRPTEHKIHILLRRDLNFGLSIGAMKQINANGRVEIDGIMSMLEQHSKIPGSIHSNDDSLRTSDKGPSIVWSTASGTNLNNFILDSGSVISTAGEVSSNLLPLNPRESEPKKVFPIIPVSSIVKGKASSTPRVSDLKMRDLDLKNVNISMTYSSHNNSHYVGYISIGDERQGYSRYHKGNLVVNGDITLNDASLYIDGNLTVNGGIKGNGSVYTSGNISILGGNSTIVTNQLDSCSIFSDGDVNLAGLDARGYLEALAQQYPDTIGKAYYGTPGKNHTDSFKGCMAAFTTFLDSKKNTGQWDFNLYKKHFSWPSNNDAYSDGFDGKLPATWLNDNTIERDRIAAFLLSFAGEAMTNHSTKGDWSTDPPIWMSPSSPDGSFGIGRNSENQVIPILIVELENTLGMNTINKIPEARKVHQALVEMFTYFRPGVMCTQSLIPEKMPWLDELYGKKDWYNMTLREDGRNTHVFWYDDNKPWRQHSMRHLFYHTINNYGLRDYNNTYNFPNDKIKLTYKEYFDIVRDFIYNNNPLDVNWLGESYLQGVFYAKGDIKISNNLTVYGAVITHGSADISDSKLIYCEEYLRMNPGIIPLTVISYREL